MIIGVKLECNSVGASTSEIFSMQYLSKWAQKIRVAMQIYNKFSLVTAPHSLLGGYNILQELLLHPMLKT